MIISTSTPAEIEAGSATTHWVGICGAGRSCEQICPVYHPGEVCTLSFAEFASLFDVA